MLNIEELYFRTMKDKQPKKKLKYDSVKQIEM